MLPIESSFLSPPPPPHTHPTLIDYPTRVPDSLKVPYPYLHQLVLINQRAPLAPPPLPPPVVRVSTPLSLAPWQEELNFHPDPVFKAFILSGIMSRFHIGFDYSNQDQLKARKGNLLSAGEHPDVVEKYIQNELELGRLLQVPHEKCLPWVHSSLFGVIPKKYKPGKWRLIVELSAPEKHAVNSKRSFAPCHKLP